MRPSSKSVPVAPQQTATQSVVDSISQELQRWILEGEIDAGQPLPPQRELALKFGTGRTSIREAIAALAACGLVTVEHGRGVFVRARERQLKFDRPSNWAFDGQLSLSDSYQIRLLVEPYAVGIMTPTLSPVAAAHLSEGVEQMRCAYDRQDFVDAARFDFDFHWTFVEASGNQTFCDLIARSASILPPPRSEPRTEAVTEHRAILDPMIAGDAEAAARAMQRHIICSAQRARITISPFNFSA